MLRQQRAKALRGQGDRALLRAGRSSAAVRLVDESLATATDATERTWFLLLRLAGIINLEHTAEYAGTVDRERTLRGEGTSPARPTGTRAFGCRAQRPVVPRFFHSPITIVPTLVPTAILIITRDIAQK